MKIGVFDSGVGGLTVLKAIRERYPRTDLVYLGDTARVPYGTKSPETVIRYSLECANFLREKGIEILVVACNTASSCALEKLRKEMPFPVVGVIEPGVEEALRRSRTGKIGVIGTQATVRSGVYQKLLKERGAQVLSRACPLFVPLVEEGLVEGEIPRKVAEHYLKELKGKVDTLILGCTHYPLLKGVIRDFLGDVEVIDSSQAVSESLRRFVRDEGGAGLELYFTDFSQNLQELVSFILGGEVEIRLAEGVFVL
ncbi:MAG: glutamate racemase [Aquificae bacterium]|nr:glutamate racemase [Aquificota bacterium]